MIVNDPTDALLPHKTEELVERLQKATGLPVGLYVQGAAGTGLLNAVVATRVGADLVATAVYPLALTLHRVAGAIPRRGAARARSPDAVSTSARCGRRPTSSTSTSATSRWPRSRRGSRCARPSTTCRRDRGRARRPPARQRRRRPAARHARRAPTDPRRGGLAAARISDRADPRVAGDDQRALGASLRDGARRVPAASWTAAYGATPAPIEAVIAGAGRRAPSAPRPCSRTIRRAQRTCSRRRGGLAASEEDLVLLAMFGDDAESLLQTIRQRHTGEASLLDDDVDAERAGRIRELVKIVQESGVAEIEIEDEGMRVSVRRADEPAVAAPTVATDAAAAAPVADRERRRDAGRVADGGRRSIARPNPGSPPFVEVGDVGQRRADVVPARGDEALQRAEGGGRRDVRVDPRRQRAACRVRARSCSRSSRPQRPPAV